MFKILVSQYINKNMVEYDFTFKNLFDRCNVPISTLHAYAQGKTSNPNEENLIRIAKAFGDGPEVIQAMRRQSLESTAKENMILARSDDPELMEKYGQLIRSSVAQILEEYRAASAAQQTEIIQHADQRVADAKEEASKQCELVAEQCRQHEQEYKEHCDALIAQIEDTISYLRALVRNVSLLAGLFGAYALYAYKTFDVNDLERGLYRGGRTDLPLILLAVILFYVLVSIASRLISRRVRKS